MGARFTIAGWLGKTSLAFSFALMAEAVSAEKLELYGRLNVSVQNANEAVKEKVEIKNNASRVGVRGELPLEGELKAIYQLEFGVNIDGKSSGDHITPRNQFVGLTGGFGTIKVGRHDTALKEAQGDFDLFNDFQGDIASTFNGENRLADYIAYITPTFASALSVNISFFPGEDAAAGEDRVGDRTSMSLVYETELIYAAVARDFDVDGMSVDTTRLVGGYTFGPAQVMMLYQRTDAGSIDEDGFGASLAYTFGKNIAKLQYLKASIWRINPHIDPIDNLLDSQLSIGLDHKLGAFTKVFAFYTTGDIGGTSSRNDYAVLGIEHRF